MADPEFISAVNLHTMYNEMQQQQLAEKIAQRLSQSSVSALPPDVMTYIKQQEAKIAELEQRLAQTSKKTNEFIDPRQEYQLGIVKMFVQENLELNPTARVRLDEIKDPLLVYAKDRGCDINYKEVPGLLLKAAGLKRKESNGKTYYEGCRMKTPSPVGNR